MKPIIIFLMGKAQSGKDTLADIITEQIEYTYEGEYPVASFAFADVLKDICARNHGFIDKKDGRDILISVGDSIRKIDDKAFVRPVAHFINIYKELGYKVFLITDLRFENEYNSLIEMVDCVPFVIRTQGIYEHQNISIFAKNHPTENLVFTPDYNVVLPVLNRETFPKVEQEVIKTINDIISRYKEEIKI